MPKLSWDESGSRYFNAGVDRGVLYLDDTAVPWNGLISVDERAAGGEIIPIYLDGLRIRNLSSLSEYEATITAFYSPPEFDACDGTYLSQYEGFYATNQLRKPFALSYRTGFTNDTSAMGYKIHLIYNAMAEPSQTTYNTITDTPEASNLSWDIKTVPNFDMTQYISAHYIFDTTRVPDYVTAAFEEIIYGSDSEEARLPTSTDIQNVFVDFWHIDVTQKSDSTYSITGTSKSVVDNGDSYSINGPTVVDMGGYYSITTG